MLNSNELQWDWTSVWFGDSALNYLILTSIGIQLKDLIALHTALPDTMDGHLLNVQKMIRLSNIMSQLLQAQTSPPALQPNLELIKMLRVIHVLLLHSWRDKINTFYFGVLKLYVVIVFFLLLYSQTSCRQLPKMSNSDGHLWEVVAVVRGLMTGGRNIIVCQ